MDKNLIIKLYSNLTNMYYIQLKYQIYFKYQISIHICTFLICKLVYRSTGM